MLEEPFTCEEGWSAAGLRWTGIRLADIFALAQPRAPARLVRVCQGMFALRLHRGPGARSGPIPPGARVLHTCGRRLCQQPKHLILSTKTSARAMVRSGVWRPTTVCGERNGHARLTEADVRVMRSLREHGEPVWALAQRFGVYSSTVSAACQRKTWKHVA